MQKLALAVLMVAPLLNAQANDWQFKDTSSRNNPQGECILSTGIDNGRTEWTLELRVKKKSPAPLEVFLTQRGRGSSSYFIPLSETENLTFGKISREGRTDIFWNIPQNTKKLIELLLDRKDLDLRAADGGRNPRLSFSTRGFERAKKRLEERCLEGRPFFDQDFEKDFVKNARVQNPLGLTEELMTELRDLYQRAYGIHLEQGVNASEVIALRNRFARELNEKSSLEARIKKLSTQDIPSVREEALQNDRAEAMAQAELDRLKAEIPRIEVSIRRAQEVFQQADAEIAPFRAEHASRTSEAVTMRRSVQNGQARIRNLENERANAYREIGQLEEELRAAQVSSQRTRQVLRNAEIELRQAESEFQMFNPLNELRRRLNADFELSRLERELPRASREVRRLESDVRQARSKRDRIESDLRSCQRTPEANCSSLESDLRSANSDLDRLKDQERAAERDERRIRSRISSIRNFHERQVENMRQMLAQRLREAQSRVIQFRSDLERVESRISHISQFEIPTRQNRIYAIDRDLPGVISQVNRERPEAQRLETELASFERRVGWQAKFRAFTEAKSQLDQRNLELASARTKERIASQNVANARVRREELTRTLAQLDADLLAAENRLAVVETSLGPYRSEMARLEAQGSEISARFENLSAQFGTRLP